MVASKAIPTHTAIIPKSGSRQNTATQPAIIPICAISAAGMAARTKPSCCARILLCSETLVEASSGPSKLCCCCIPTEFTTCGQFCATDMQFTTGDTRKAQRRSRRRSNSARCRDGDLHGFRARVLEFQGQGELISWSKRLLNAKHHQMHLTGSECHDLAGRQVHALEGNHADDTALILFGVKFDVVGDWRCRTGKLVRQASSVLHAQIDRRSRAGRGARPSRRNSHIPRYRLRMGRQTRR